MSEALGILTGGMVLALSLARTIHRINNPSGSDRGPELRKGFDPGWYANPDYKQLGSVTEQWLCDNRRNPFA